MERFGLLERMDRPMGDNDFLEGIEKYSGRILRPLKPGPKKKNTNNDAAVKSPNGEFLPPRQSLLADR